MNFRGGKSRRPFAIFSVAVLAYNLPVILWGAYVRVSFSGDGCGANWPSCNGQFLLRKMTVPTAIEYTHRIMTSLDTVAVLALVVWAFLAFAKASPVRRYAVWSLVFLLIEALLGAGLVLFRLVAKDQSAGRVWYLSAHLVNTMLLLASLAITAWLAWRGKKKFRLLSARKTLLAGLCATILVSVTGSVAALGDTLFPASSLSSGMAQDFTAGASLLVRLRVLHPILAVAVALYLLWLSASVIRGGQAGNATRGAVRAANWLIGLTVLQVFAGMLNLVLLAPLGMQLIHLLTADVVWIAALLVVVESIYTPVVTRELVNA